MRRSKRTNKKHLYPLLLLCALCWPRAVATTTSHNPTASLYGLAGEVKSIIFEVWHHKMSHQQRILAIIVMCSLSIIAVEACLHLSGRCYWGTDNINAGQWKRCRSFTGHLKQRFRAHDELYQINIEETHTQQAPLDMAYISIATVDPNQH